MGPCTRCCAHVPCVTAGLCMAAFGAQEQSRLGNPEVHGVRKHGPPRQGLPAWDWLRVEGGRDVPCCGPGARGAITQNVATSKAWVGGPGAPQTSWGWLQHTWGTGWWGCDFGASVAKEKRSRMPKTVRWHDREPRGCDGEPRDCETSSAASPLCPLAIPRAPRSHRTTPAPAPCLLGKLQHV